jgi:peptidoglycan hydrolase CwlO-like protein
MTSVVGIFMTRRNIRLSIFALALMGVALIAILGVYESIPAKANPPDKTAEAIRDLQKSQQQAADQLRVFQQAVSSDRTELKRLSDDVTALTAKIEALQESFASAQQATAVQPTEPTRQKRATAR